MFSTSFLRYHTWVIARVRARRLRAMPLRYQQRIIRNIRSTRSPIIPSGAAWQLIQSLLVFTRRGSRWACGAAALCSLAPSTVTWEVFPSSVEISLSSLHCWALPSFFATARGVICFISGLRGVISVSIGWDNISSLFVGGAWLARRCFVVTVTFGVAGAWVFLSWKTKKSEGFYYFSWRNEESWKLDTIFLFYFWWKMALFFCLSINQFYF